jgi:hypothetical protein
VLHQNLHVLKDVLHAHDTILISKLAVNRLAMKWVPHEITTTLPAQSAWWKLEKDASLKKPEMGKNQNKRDNCARFYFSECEPYEA